MKVEVPDFLALEQRMSPSPKTAARGLPTPALSDYVTLALCSEGKSGKAVLSAVRAHVRQIEESFSDPVIIRASEDFNIFHSTIKLPVPAGVFSQTVCLRACMFHITEGYIILSAGTEFHLICLGMEMVS